jgi:hypothetical protein
MPVFWDVESGISAHCLHRQGDESVNVGKLLTDYTAQHPTSDLHTRRRKNLKSNRIKIISESVLSPANQIS